MVVERHLGGLRAADLMVREPVTAREDLSLARFLDEVVWPHRYTSYPVVDRTGRLSGLIAFRSLAKVPRADLARHTVGQHAQPLAGVPTVGPETPLVDAMQEMAVRGAGRALVVADGRLEGLLSSTDILRALEARRTAAAPDGLTGVPGSR